MTENQQYEDEPCYVISVAAKLVQLHPQTLRYYDKIGLIKPSRTEGRIRLYSQRDIERLRKIARLTEDLGVNLAGVEVILNMTKRIEELQHRLATLQRQYQAEINMLRQRIQELEKAQGGAEYPVIRIATAESEPGSEAGDRSATQEERR